MKLDDVIAAGGAQLREGERLGLVRVGSRYVAHPLTGGAALRQELVPADAVVRDGQVHLLDEGPYAAGTGLAISGCTPALSLWLRLAEILLPEQRIFWIYANSTVALQSLARGEVHCAGAHLFDAETGECNTPFVRRYLPDRPCVLVNLGQWDEGLVVARGNPLGIKGVADLLRPDVRFVNREEGTGARLLVRYRMEQAGLRPEEISGWNRIVLSQLQVVREVASGAADAGCGAVTAANLYGLDFIPLIRIRFDLAFPVEHWETPAVQQLVGTLKHPWVRAQLTAMQGLDASLTGEVVART